MKVLFVTSALCKGGAETQLVKLAMFLKSLNHEVLIILLKPINEFNNDFENEGISLFLLKDWKLYGFSNIRLLYKKVKEYKPDVVLAFMFISIIVARILKKFLKFKLISTIRITVIPNKWYIPFKFTSGMDDAIVYNSQASKKSFESTGLIKQEGIVIYNGIHFPMIEKGKDKFYPKDQFVWVCVAHFRWNKDYNTLFKAIKTLKGRNFRVDIIGEYTPKDNPHRIIKKLGIEEHVNILGFQQNTSESLKKADAFVLSSHSEGMPNALLEAMAHAKPVVVTDIDCNREVVQYAECGFLSKIENDEDLAVKMLGMMTMPANHRTILGEKGRLYIKENFDEDIVMDNWLSIINQHATTQNILVNS